MRQKREQHADSTCRRTKLISPCNCEKIVLAQGKINFSFCFFLSEVQAKAMHVFLVLFLFH
jgi:hypothetical protein